MDILKQQNLLFVYLCGILDEQTNRIELKHIDSLKYTFQEFEEEILIIREEIFERIENENILELFCIVGRKEYIKEIDEIISDPMKNGDLLNINSTEDTDILKTFISLYLIHLVYDGHIRIPKKLLLRLDQIEAFCLYSNSKLEDDRVDLASSTFKIWFDNEKPFLFGKQIITTSFMLDDLKGRRIISHLPDCKTGETFLLLEGGLKLYLSLERPYIREKLNSSDIDLITIGEIDTIVSNPIYAFKKYFEPYELYEDWQKVLNYVLAISINQWKEKDIRKIHKSFMRYMEQEICDNSTGVKGKPIINKDIYYQCYLETLRRTNAYFTGKDETIFLKIMYNC